MTLSGISDPAAQLRTANGSTLAIATIETKTALQVLDDILGVEGLDGVFVGPSDLSVTLTHGERVAPSDSIVDGPIRDIAARAQAAGKIAGAFAGDGERVRFCRDAGYGLVALSNDQAHLARGISEMLADADGRG